MLVCTIKWFSGYVCVCAAALTGSQLSLGQPGVGGANVSDNQKRRKNGFHCAAEPQPLVF